MSISPTSISRDDANATSRYEGYVYRAPEVVPEQVTANANPENWTWPEYEKEDWKLADFRWQDFLKKWRSEPDESFEGPNYPSLSLDRMQPLLFVFIDKLYVPTCYVEALDTIWRRAFYGNATQSLDGVLVTGQPGNGKSCFLIYLLIRLLQRKQNVLFNPYEDAIFLFFEGQVYTRAGSAMDHPLGKGRFMWSLVDARGRDEPTTGLRLSGCFLVQTASPDPVCYKRWVKRKAPLIMGLPTWTKEELAIGLTHQPWYDVGFKRHLVALLQSMGGVGDQKVSTRGLFHLRHILHDCFSEGAPSIEEVIDAVLDAVILRSGHAARDVYNDLIHGSDHSTWNIDYDALKTAVCEELPYMQTPEICLSHSMITVNPVQRGNSDLIDWRASLISEWIRRQLVWHLYEARRDSLWADVRMFEGILQARLLASCVRQVYGHYALTRSSGSPRPLIRMTTLPSANEASDPDSPVFVVSPNILAETTFEKTTRQVHKFDFLSDLPSTFEHEKYYVPIRPRFPSFDAFTVDLNLDASPKSATLWVIQMASAETYAWSAQTYKAIAKVRSALGDQLAAASVDAGDEQERKRADCVAVRYVLVSSYCTFAGVQPSETSVRWSFPKGFLDHQGDVFWLKLDVFS